MRVLGLISGTSVDGIDGAIVDINGQGYAIEATLVETVSTPYPATLREQILQVCAGAPLSMAALADLDDAIAQAFAAAAQRLMAGSGPVDLIASHGQTLFHRPPTQATADCSRRLGYSLQLGRGEALSQLTGCPTVSNFRQADIAAGGEGAPLVPPVDAVLLSHPDRDRCVQNIGGIGNVTVLPPWRPQVEALPPLLGWDTGPGNSLLDLATQHLSQGAQTYDHDGRWAAQGTPHASLITAWMSHPYFQQPPPKSTGRECFGWDFLQQCLQSVQSDALSPADWLATLTEFTAISIATSYRQFLPHLPDEVLLCGGGSRNQYLVSRLQAHLPNIPVAGTETVGISSDFKEAIAFAVLGYWRYQGVPGNVPSVTGAARSVLLGDLHWPGNNQK